VGQYIDRCIIPSSQLFSIAIEELEMKLGDEAKAGCPAHSLGLIVCRLYEFECEPRVEAILN
jgi:hypothetical protein